jgi:hypothetical protein
MHDGFRTIRCLATVGGVALCLTAVFCCPVAQAASVKKCTLFSSVSVEHGISGTQACAVAIAAESANAWRCVYEGSATGGFPVPKVERRKFMGYTLTGTPAKNVRFQRRGQVFVLMAQCS